MKNIFKYLSILLLSISSLFINSSNDNQSDLISTNDEEISLRAKNANGEEKEPNLTLIRYYEDNKVNAGGHLPIYLNAKEILVSSLQLEIRYDDRYLNLDSYSNYIPINASRGDLIDINDAEKGVIKITFSSLYNCNLNGDIFYFPFYADYNTPDNTRTYINVIVKKAINMDDINVEVLSKGYYVDIFNQDDNGSGNKHLYSYNYGYFAANEYKNNEEARFYVQHSSGDNYSSFDLRIDYDRDLFEFVSYTFPEFPNFLGDVNASIPGIIRVKGSSTKDIPNDTEIVSITFKTINKVDTKAYVYTTFNSLINSNYEKVECNTAESICDLTYMKGNVANINLKLLQPDHVYGLSYGLFIEIDEPLGAIDITISDNWIFSEFEFKECIPHDIKDASIGVNLTQINNSIIKISLLSSKGVSGKLHICTINFNPSNAYYNSFGGNVNFYYSDAVSPDLKKLKLEVLPCTDQIAHTHRYEWTILTESTCQQMGKRHGVCICGHETDEYMKRLPHTVDKWEITKEPTYFMRGEKKGYCSSCKRNITQFFDRLLGDEDFKESSTFAIGFLKANVCGTNDNTPASSDLFLEQAKLFENLSENSKRAFKEEKIMTGEYGTFHDVLCKYERILMLHGADSKKFPNFMRRDVFFINDTFSGVLENWSNPETLTNVGIVFLCLLPLLSIPVVVLIVDKRKHSKNTK